MSLPAAEPVLQGSQAHSFGHHHTPAAADFLEPMPGANTLLVVFFGRMLDANGI